MRILNIVGSNVVNAGYKTIPPGQGPLERLASKCAAELAAAGHDAETVFLRQHEILFCDHCEICDRAENCNKHDDFWPIYQSMKAADAMIFYTSVTFAMMSPKLAALLQRAGRIARRHGRKFSGERSGVFLEEFTWGGNLVLQQFKFWLESNGMQPPATARAKVGRQSDGRHSTAAEMEAMRQKKARDLPRRVVGP